MSTLCQLSCVPVFLLAGVIATGCAAPGNVRYRNNHGASGAITSTMKFFFDDHATDRIPAGWSIRQTNPTQELASWKVVADQTAPSGPNAFALTKTENHDGTFNLAIADRTSYKDLDLTVKVKAVSGEEDQGGGPIWRCKDQNNYYITRYNPLESNFRVYKVVDGKRKKLDSARVTTVAGKWYTLRVTMIGDKIVCYLDGDKMLEATDDTFAVAGMVGLWTKADAVTSFDDMTVTPR